MKTIIIIFFVITTHAFHVFSYEPKLQEVINGFNSPWSFSFINNNKVIVTEKSGNLILVNFNNKKLKKLHTI